MFLQPDWFEVLRPGVGTNRFSYSFNDPVNLSDPSGNCPPCAVGIVIEGVKWAGVAIGIGVGAYVVSENDGGSILSTPVEDFDFGDEGFSSDPSASNPSILSTPIDGGPNLSIEGMTAHESSGPSILSTPINDAMLGANIVEASRLRESLGLATGQRELAHHNIPREHQGLPAVQAGIGAGYEFDGAMNGTRVLGQAGEHPEYNRRIGQDLEDLWTLGEANGWTDAQYRDKLQEISDRERDRIENDNRYVRNK
jgi:hypothetical protein